MLLNPTFTIQLTQQELYKRQLLILVLETQVGDIITIPNAEVGGTGQNITLNVDSVTAGDKTMTVARSRRTTRMATSFNAVKHYLVQLEQIKN